MIELDHIAIAGETRDIAAVYVQKALDVALQPGGQHAYFATHNHLMGLANGLYLEAISIDPDAAKPKYPRWFALDDFSGPPRLTNWVCRTADICAIVDALPEAGQVVWLSRGDLKWRMAVPRDGRLPFDGCFPALIQWDCPHPAPHLEQHNIALQMLKVAHPRIDELRARLAPFIDVPLVEFSTARVPALEASFATPSGIRKLR